VPLRLLNRSATNAYFPVSISVISIPEADDPVMAKVIELWADLADIKEFDELKVMLRVAPRLKVAFDGFKAERIFEAIRQKQGSAPKQTVIVKEAEFSALSNVKPEQITDRPDGIFFATELKKESWQGPLMKGVSKVVLVHRLREVMAQVGFTRLEGMSNNTNGEMDLSIQPAMLASSIEWLTAVENRGEGSSSRVFGCAYRPGEADQKPAHKAHGRGPLGTASRLENGVSLGAARSLGL
jgi:hypothetical protein